MNDSQSQNNQTSHQDKQNQTTSRDSENTAQGQPVKHEKMDVPQRPGSQIVIGPEGPYSEDTLRSPPSDSDAR